MILTVTKTKLKLLLQACKINTYMHTYVLYDVHKAWWWPVETAETCSNVK